MKTKEEYQMEVLLELLKALKSDWSAFEVIQWINDKQMELRGEK